MKIFDKNSMEIWKIFAFVFNSEKWDNFICVISSLCHGVRVCERQESLFSFFFPSHPNIVPESQEAFNFLSDAFGCNSRRKRENFKCWETF